MPSTLNYRDPIGVVPPVFAAAAVMADLHAKKAGEAKFHPARTPVVLPGREATKRTRLFARARKGDAVAIRALQSEYRLRLVPVGAGG